MKIRLLLLSQQLSAQEEIYPRQEKKNHPDRLCSRRDCETEILTHIDRSLRKSSYHVWGFRRISTQSNVAPVGHEVESLRRISQKNFSEESLKDQTHQGALAKAYRRGAVWLCRTGENVRTHGHVVPPTEQVLRHCWSQRTSVARHMAQTSWSWRSWYCYKVCYQWDLNQVAVRSSRVVKRSGFPQSTLWHSARHYMLWEVKITQCVLTHHACAKPYTE